jgi:cytochrome c-type biogenesis protein CcmH
MILSLPAWRRLPRPSRTLLATGLLAAALAAALATALWLAYTASQRDAAAPTDGRAWVLQAYRDAEAGRWAEAASAFEQAVALSRKVAADPAVWCEWADALGMAQGRSLAGRPTELIERALALNAAHPKALEMAGSAAYERGDFRRAAVYWQTLWVQLAEGSAERGDLAKAVQRAERLAATSLPPAQR